MVKPKKTVVSTGLIGLNEVTDRQVRGFSGSGTHTHPITHKSITLITNPQLESPLCALDPDCYQTNLTHLLLGLTRKRIHLFISSLS